MTPAFCWQHKYIAVASLWGSAPIHQRRKRGLTLLVREFVLTWKSKGQGLSFSLLNNFWGMDKKELMIQRKLDIDKEPCFYLHLFLFTENNVTSISLFWWATFFYFILLQLWESQFFCVLYRKWKLYWEFSGQCSKHSLLPFRARLQSASYSEHSTWDQHSLKGQLSGGHESKVSPCWLVYFSIGAHITLKKHLGKQMFSQNKDLTEDFLSPRFKLKLPLL